MKDSLSLRSLVVFFALDVVLGAIAISALSRVLGIAENATAQTTLWGANLLKTAVWALALTRQLQPFERFARMPPAARTPAMILAADRAVQSFALRFGVFYALSWGACFGLSFVFLWSLGEQVVPLGSNLSLLLPLLLGAIVLGVFSVSFPIGAHLTTEPANTCFGAAQKAGMVLERVTLSFETRLVVVGACLALAPSCWALALGFQGRFESDRARRISSVELVTLAVARAAETSAEASAFGSGEAERIVAGLPSEALSASVFDAEGHLVGSASTGLGSNDRRLSEVFSRTRHGTEHGVLSSLRDPRVLAFHRVPSGNIVVVEGSAEHGATNPIGGGLLFALFVAVWATLSTTALGRVVSGPIQRLTAAARVVVEEGRLSQMESVAIARDDDVGELATHFNQVLALMRSLGEAANAVARGDLLFEVGGEGELPDAFRGMLASLGAIVRQIRSTSIELASAATEIFAAAQEQESAAAAQSSAMVEISRTMESLSLSAAHVSEAVQGVLGNAERTLQNTDDMVERIGSLTRHAGRIGEILEVIRDISDRSDLLALNGSLEASRAGDAGRGFALVAAEMRRLAERVTASVHDVKKLVSDIRDSGSSTVIATEESRKLADGTTEAARQITFVSQQQRSGTEQVSQSVKSIAEVVSQAASATSEIRTAAESLKSHADRLAEIVRGFSMAGEEPA